MINKSDDSYPDLRDQVGWNIAASRANLLFSLLNKSTSKYLAGDLKNWYWSLTAIREILNCDLRDEEKIKLDKIEENANLVGTYYEKWHSFEEDERKQNKTYKKIRKVYAKIIRQYQRHLIDLLKECGFFPVKEDRTDLGF
jgi:hypothetical protein